MSEIYWPGGEAEGYPQAEGAHPLLPWWREVSTVDGSVLWSRGKGHILSLRIPVQQLEEVDVVSLPFLIAYERDHPRPCPPPKVGQVWMNVTTKIAAAVVRVRGDTGILYNADPRASLINDVLGAEWPPREALCVFGPHAPWAPLSYLDTLEAESAPELNNE